MLLSHICFWRLLFSFFFLNSRHLHGRDWRSCLCVWQTCWWIYDMSFFYFAETYSQQDFWCSFLQQMVQFTAPSGNMPLSKRTWSSGWHILPFKVNLWGDLRVLSICISPTRSCWSLRLLQDILWQTLGCSCCSWKSLYSCASSNAVVPLCHVVIHSLWFFRDGYYGWIPLSFASCHLS